MSLGTPIEWTDATWPIVAGCEYESPGCAHCWAVRDSWRLAHNPNPKVHNAYFGTVDKTDKGALVWSGIIRPLWPRLDWPLKWRTPRRIFVCSQSDLFHPKVPADFIAKTLEIMARCPQHIFQVLTKHAARMQQLLAHDLPYEGPQWPLPNVHIGVTVEDSRRARERIEALLATPAAVRWLSNEPLLEAIDLSPWLGAKRWFCTAQGRYAQIDWIVAGGESGPKARPMHPDWARSLRDQCAAAGVPFLFKQHGDWIACETEPDMDRRSGRVVHPLDDEIELERDGPYKVIEAHGLEFVRVGKKVAGRKLDGRIHEEFPR